MDRININNRNKMYRKSIFILKITIKILIVIIGGVIYEKRNC